MSNSNTRTVIAAPTFNQVKRIYWSGNLNVPDLIPNQFIKNISHSDHKITLINDSTIELMSGETPERFEGSFAHLVVLDECGDLDLQNVLQRSIYPMVAPTHGKIYLLGVPRQSMSGFYKEMALKYSDKKKYPNWSCYSWKSADVLDPDEIARIKTEIDPLLFQQEFEGIFHSGGGGLAFHQFSKEKHVAPVEYSPGLPLFVTCDWNTSFMSWNICQIFPNGKVAVLDEVTSRHTNVFTHVPLVKAKLIEICGGLDNAKKRGTTFFGDYSGNSNTVASRGSVYQELSNLFAVDRWAHAVKIKTNPHIDRRVAATNAKLCSAAGVVSIRIDPKCKNLIRDFELISWADLQREKAKLEKQELTHTVDGFSYMINYFWPLSSVLF